MASKVIFDGPNLLVIVKAGITELEVQKDIYSAWKEDAILLFGGNDLLKFPPLFTESIGGNDFGSGKSLAAFFIFNNTDGWRIRPAEEDRELLIDGNMFPIDPLSPLSVPTLGDSTVLITLQRSVDAIAVGAGTPPPTVSDISTGVWNELESNPRTAGSFGEKFKRAGSVIKQAWSLTKNPDTLHAEIWLEKDGEPVPLPGSASLSVTMRDRDGDSQFTENIAAPNGAGFFKVDRIFAPTSGELLASFTAITNAPETHLGLAALAFSSFA